MIKAVLFVLLATVTHSFVPRTSRLCAPRQLKSLRSAPCELTEVWHAMTGWPRVGGNKPFLTLTNVPVIFRVTGFFFDFAMTSTFLLFGLSLGSSRRVMIQHL
jgi:hypothetical protein